MSLTIPYILVMTLDDSPVQLYIVILSLSDLVLFEDINIAIYDVKTPG
jgi:hypothetical protein